MAISAPPPTHEPVIMAIVGFGNPARDSSAALVPAE
jgi:hypothetical protein